MPDYARTIDLDLRELDVDLGDLIVTSMRDKAALYEGAPVWNACSCVASSSCVDPQLDTGVTTG
ncbi:thiazolylpeptide-type bacteriocin [Streptomyces sp. NPDC006512]|uniref:thiazolylpeptide-type bacteriocin n=1 Tax=Streptomyces sp. NPDC006512 TaxID=3154307 RepID=UPI00339E2319